MNPNNTDTYSFNIPRILSVIKIWKRKIIFFMTALGLIAGTLLFITPNEYYAYSTAIPTNSSLSDKSYIFNDKIDALYSSLGSYTELERLKSIADLDTSFKYLIETFALLKHYQLEQGKKDIAIQKAILLMRREKINVEKAEGGLFRIHAWDRNPDTAALMANALMEYTEKATRELQLAYNKSSLNQIAEKLATQTHYYKALRDSLAQNNSAAEQELLQVKIANAIANITELEKMKNQFELIIKFQQPSLRIVDKATPNYKHVKPKRIYSFMTTMLIGFLCCILLVTLLESIVTYKNALKHG